MVKNQNTTPKSCFKDQRIDDGATFLNLMCLCFIYSCVSRMSRWDTSQMCWVNHLLSGVYGGYTHQTKQLKYTLNVPWSMIQLLLFVETVQHIWKMLHRQQHIQYNMILLMRHPVIVVLSIIMTYPAVSHCIVLPNPHRLFFRMPCAVFVIGHKKHCKMSAQARHIQTPANIL